MVGVFIYKFYIICVSVKDLEFEFKKIFLFSLPRYIDKFLAIPSAESKSYLFEATSKA